MRYAIIAAAALALAGSTAALENTASAQEIVLTGPLKGKPPVIGLRQYRQGRFEIAPAFTFSLLDEYRRTIIVGAKLQYNFTDWLGIGVWGGYGLINYSTDLTDQINQVAPRNNLTATNLTPNGPKNGASSDTDFNNQVSRLQWVVAPQISVAPFRGKLALFQALFVDTEAYLFAGIAFVGTSERGDCGADKQLACNAPKSFDRTGKFNVTGTFGLGLTFFMADFINLGVEYRALPFAWNRAGFDSRGSGPNGDFPDNKIDGEDRTFKFNQMFTVSVGFMLGSRKTSK
ncbi:hypothetical protein BH09MYX1_BH09MYX1_60660 [soil metagenome]